FVGKRWVHMVEDYDRLRGISYWRKNYRTGIEDEDPEALTRRYHYYDPISTLPEEGQEWWRAKKAEGLEALLDDLLRQQGIEVGAWSRRGPGDPDSRRRREPARAAVS